MRTTFLLSSSLLVLIGLTMTVSAQSKVTVIPNAQMTEAFKKSEQVLNAGGYKINAGMRNAPGQSELHELDTDIFYIIDGTAVFVTGGTMEGGKTTAPGETRGTGVTGGETITLTKGDVIVVPKGVPHWFKEVKTPVFHYFVVKTTATPTAK